MNSFGSASPRNSSKRAFTFRLLSSSNTSSIRIQELINSSVFSISSIGIRNFHILALAPYIFLAYRHFLKISVVFGISSNFTSGRPDISAVKTVLYSSRTYFIYLCRTKLTNIDNRFFSPFSKNSSPELLLSVVLANRVSTKSSALFET